MYVMLISIHLIYCDDTRYIDILKIVSMPVSLSCALQYDDTFMHYPISTDHDIKVNFVLKVNEIVINLCIPS